MQACVNLTLIHRNLPKLSLKCIYANSHVSMLRAQFYSGLNDQILQFYHICIHGNMHDFLHAGKLNFW